MKYAITTGLGTQACELIYFNVGMMIDTIPLYILMLVWMALTFTHSHMVTKKVELVQSLCC